MVFKKLGWIKNLSSPDKLLSGCGYQCYSFKIEGDIKLDSLYERMFSCFVGLVWFLRSTKE